MNTSVCAELDVQDHSLATHRAYMFPATVFTLLVLIFFLFVFVILWCAELRCCRRKRRCMSFIHVLSDATRQTISQSVSHNVTSLMPRYLAMYPEHFPPQPWFDGIRQSWKQKLQEALSAADSTLIWPQLFSQACREDTVTDLRIFWTPRRCHGATAAEINGLKFLTTFTTKVSRIESDQILRLEILVEQVLRELVLDSLFPGLFSQSNGDARNAQDRICEHAAKEFGYQRCTVRVFRKNIVDHAMRGGADENIHATETDGDEGMCILITYALELPQWQRKVEKYERDGTINGASEKWHIGSYMDGFSPVGSGRTYYQRMGNNGRLGDKYLWLYHWVLPRCVFPKRMLTFLIAFLVFWGLAVTDLYSYDTTQSDYCSTDGFCVENQDCFITNIGPSTSDVGLVQWWESTFSTNSHTPDKGDFARCDKEQQIYGVFCYRKLLLSPTNILSSLGIAWSVFQVLLGVDALADLLPRYRFVSAVLLIASAGAVVLSIDGMINPWTNPTDYDVSFLGYYVLFLVAVLIFSYSLRHLIVTELGLVDSFLSCQKEYRKHAVLRTMQMTAARADNTPISTQELYGNLRAPRCTKHACQSKTALCNCIDLIKSGWGRNYQELFGNPQTTTKCCCCRCCSGHQIEDGNPVDTSALQLVSQTLHFLHEDGKIIKCPTQGASNESAVGHVHDQQPKGHDQAALASMVSTVGSDERWIVAPELPWKPITRLWMRITAHIKTEMERTSRAVKRDIRKAKQHALVSSQLTLLDDEVQQFTEHAIRTTQEAIWSMLQENVASMVHGVYATMTSAGHGSERGSAKQMVDAWFIKHSALVMQLRRIVQVALTTALQQRLKPLSDTTLHSDLQEFLDAVRDPDTPLMNPRSKDAFAHLINQHLCQQKSTSPDLSSNAESPVDPVSLIPAWTVQLPASLQSMLQDPGGAIIDNIEPNYVIGLALSALSWMLAPRRFEPSIDLDPEALFSFIPDVNGIKAKIGLYRSVVGTEDDGFSILLKSTRQQLQKMQHKLITQRPSVSRFL
eukprot:m.596463 g.596463  ORF g.596463 m.596463 type:complete len:1024 (-) comp22410_c0_seq4:234-3305(-)